MFNAPAAAEDPKAKTPLGVLGVGIESTL